MDFTLSPAIVALRAETLRLRGLVRELEAGRVRAIKMQAVLLDGVQAEIVESVKHLAIVDYENEGDRSSTVRLEVRDLYVSLLGVYKLTDRLRLAKHDVRDKQRALADELLKVVLGG